MVSLLGIGWFEGNTSAAPSGLLVGRFERRAWLNGQHLRPDEDIYDVQIGLEPDRVELADLELDVEERVGEETVVSERLRLEDVDLRDVEDALHAEKPSRTGRPAVTVALPTLGRRTKRTVRLHHRDGSMLDDWPPFHLVESIGMTMEVNGAASRPSGAASDVRPPTSSSCSARCRVRRHAERLRFQAAVAEPPGWDVVRCALRPRSASPRVDRARSRRSGDSGRLGKDAGPTP